MSVTEEAQAPAVDAPPPEEAPVTEEPKQEEKPTRQTKPRTPKERKPAQPKPKTKTASHPPYFQMIMEALMALNEKSGSSPYAIAKHMEEKHKAVLPANFRKTLALQLKNSAARGKLIKIRASYKLSEAGKKEKSTAKTSAVSKPKAEKKIKTTSAAKKPGKKNKMSTAAKPKQPKSIKSSAAKKSKKSAA
ncbi:hypothetical protein C1H46_036813 [Malus baccata]|uniref:H15 domain-containing protein n=1 Tax=Malus baccata TaxID=106549 RepID=A0A540KUG8_MALBA|nr:hypothetical protein C1H46_036813 [Malus baccata]